MENNKNGFFAKRLIIYFLGQFLIATGVVISINSNLGVSPVNSLPYVVSVITNFPLSWTVIGVFAFYMLLQIIILRKNYKPIMLFQIVVSSVFGYMVDAMRLVIGWFVIPTYFGSLAMLAISMVLIAIGVFLYISANILPMPIEGLTQAIADTLGKPFSKMKVWVDCASVITATALCLIFLGELNGVREGTILSALLIGKIIPPIKAIIGPTVQKFCFGEVAVAPVEAPIETVE